MTSAAELETFAIELAREAGELARRRRTEGVAVAATKSNLADIVTEADREVERLIRRRLAEQRPDDGFLGEESGAERGTSDITWVVDPIDGTVNYAYGMPAYAVSIAAVSGEPDPDGWEGLAGAVYAPAIGELFHAAKGGGAWVDGRRLEVRAEPSQAGALIAVGFGYDPATHASTLETIARAMPLARDVRRVGAASLDFAYVAAGRLDAYFERGLAPWDFAAGAVLVAEAGGMFGRPDEGDEYGRVLNVAAGPALFERLGAAVLD